VLRARHCCTVPRSASTAAAASRFVRHLAQLSGSRRRGFTASTRSDLLDSRDPSG